MHKWNEIKYRSSSNNSRGPLLFFPHKKGAIIRGKRLFQTLLTGSHALNIFFYYPIKPKIDQSSNKLNMGFLSVPSLFP